MHIYNYFLEFFFFSTSKSKYLYLESKFSLISAWWIFLSLKMIFFRGKIVYRQQIFKRIYNIKIIQRKKISANFNHLKRLFQIHILILV